LTLRDNQICNDEKTACVIVSLRQLSSGRDRFKAILFVAAFPSRLSRYNRHWFEHSAMGDLLGENIALVQPNNLYRCLDKLTAHTRRATEVAIAIKSLNRMNQIGRAIFTRIA